MAGNDDQTLLTSKEMADKKQKYLYFDDGERKIDCIIAFDVPAEDDDAASKDSYRKTYFENLQKKGLEIEKADCKQVFFHYFITFYDLILHLLSTLLYIVSVFVSDY